MSDLIWIKKEKSPSEEPEPELDLNNRPSILYHYCGTEAFFGIVNSGVIWLSNSYMFNDYKENTWIHSFFEEKIRELRNDKTSHFIDKVISIYNRNNPIPYVASFSSECDILSQWRAYTGDGKGFSIGINPKSLGIKFRPAVTSDNTDLTFGIMPVCYDVEEQRLIINCQSPRHR